MTSNSISVVVPTRNRGLTIGATITSILDTNPQPRELIVVDQSDSEQAALTHQAVADAARAAGVPFSTESEDQQDGQAERRPTGCVRYLRSNRRGAGSARNLGSRASASSIVLFTDDDTSVDEGWIGTVQAEFDDDACVVAVYGQILLPDVNGSGQRKDGTELTRQGTRLVITEPKLPWQIGSGANMAFHRDALLACGGFDEVMTIGGPLRAFEDIDLGYRILVQKLGAIVFCPDSIVYHHTTKTFKEQLQTEVGYGIGAGAAFVKYRRSANRQSWSILGAWIWQMAISRSGAAILKWRSVRVLRLALVQLWAPLLGIKKASRFRVDSALCLFRSPADHHGDAPKVRESG